MPVAALIFRTILEPCHEARQLFNDFVVNFAPLFRAGQFCIAKYAGLAIAASPRHNRGWPLREKINPVEWIFFRVEADYVALDLVLADVVTIQVKIKRCLQLASMCTASRESTLPPAR